MATLSEIQNALGILGFSSVGTLTVSGVTYGIYYSDSLGGNITFSEDDNNDELGDSYTYSNMVKYNATILYYGLYFQYENSDDDTAYGIGRFLKYVRECTGVDVLLPSKDFCSSMASAGYTSCQGWTCSETSDYNAMYYNNGTLVTTNKEAERSGFIGIVNLSDPYIHNYGKLKIGNYTMGWDGTTLTIS